MSAYESDDAYGADQAQHSAAAGTNAVASLQAGHPFSLLLAEDDGQRVAALDAIMDAVADPGTRFIRATNPLRARLTLERLLIQVIQGGPEAVGDDPAAIIRSIADRRAGESRVILVIERSETLHPEVIHFFGRTAPLFPDGIPRLQILFTGRPEFRRMLDDPDALMDEQTAQLEAYRPKEADVVFVAPPEMSTDALPQKPFAFQEISLRAQVAAVWRQGIWTQLGIVGFTVVGAAAVTFAVLIATTGQSSPVTVDTGSALLEMPEPSELDVENPVLRAGPPQDEATAQLRREFEAYLTASGREIANATPGQRRAVYQEFLVWRARTAGSRPQ